MLLFFCLFYFAVYLIFIVRKESEWCWAICEPNYRAPFGLPIDWINAMIAFIWLIWFRCDAGGWTRKRQPEYMNNDDANHFPSAHTIQLRRTTLHYSLFGYLFIQQILNFNKRNLSGCQWWLTTTSSSGICAEKCPSQYWRLPYFSVCKQNHTTPNNASTTTAYGQFIARDAACATVVRMWSLTHTAQHQPYRSSPPSLPLALSRLNK